MYYELKDIYMCNSLPYCMCIASLNAENIEHFKHYGSTGMANDKVSRDAKSRSDIDMRGIKPDNFSNWITSFNIYIDNKLSITGQSLVWILRDHEAPADYGARYYSHEYKLFDCIHMHGPRFK